VTERTYPARRVLVRSFAGFWTSFAGAFPSTMTGVLPCSMGLPEFLGDSLVAQEATSRLLPRVSAGNNEDRIPYDVIGFAGTEAVLKRSHSPRQGRSWWFQAAAHNPRWKDKSTMCPACQKLWKNRSLQKRGALLMTKLSTPERQVTLRMRHTDLISLPLLAKRALRERAVEIQRLKAALVRGGARRIATEGIVGHQRDISLILKVDDELISDYFTDATDPTGIAREFWACQISALRRSNPRSEGLRFNSAIYRLALSLLARGGTALYNELRSFLVLPSPRSLRKKKLDKGTRSGVMFETLDANLKLFDPSKELFALSFDSMKVVDGLTFSPFSGQVAGVDDACGAMTKAAFEAAAREFASDSIRAEMDETQKQRPGIAEEYFVWILSAISGNCRIRFPVARYTTGAGKVAADLIQMFYDIERQLLVRDIRVVALTSDGAGENRQLFNALATLPASDFLPKELLAAAPDEVRDQLDAVFVARPHPIYGCECPMFLIPDPPHFIKKMVSIVT